MLANSFEQKLAMKDKSVFEIKMCTRRCGRGSYKNFMEKTCTRVLYLLHSKFKLCGKSVDTKRGASGFPLLSLFSPRTSRTSHAPVKHYLFDSENVEATPGVTWMFSVGHMISFVLSYFISSCIKNQEEMLYCKYSNGKMASRIKVILKKIWRIKYYLTDYHTWSFYFCWCDVFLSVCR